ncbi:flagellar protein FlgN [Alkalihalobacillus oceani]|uniref:Flagellar protein FlgN n=1 Tax=Halalkalibacter oceani TaxID=1653776 RepID=A0A9X2DSH2_9BACI|nr:flagellar protein FlgN [Halalkalibacter oceani]MCM3716129.1 flagellar protein FlgN [Halalkalibacter oceani]
MSVKAITELLEALITIHHELNKAAGQKVELIKKGDMPALEELVRAEAKLVRKAQATESMREKVVRTFLLSKGKVTENATLAEVKEWATTEEREQLDALQQQLVTELHLLKRQNELNQQLIEESLRFVNLSLDLMVPHQEDISYKRPNERDDQPYDTGHSLFDSKA